MPSVADPQVAASLDAVSEDLAHLGTLAIEPADVDDGYAYLRHLEAIGRRTKALQVQVLDVIKRNDLHRVDAHASPKVMVRHGANLSPAEAARRDAMAKAVRSMPMVGAAFADGSIGPCQVERIARTLGNPRVRAAFIEQDAHVVVLAHRLPYVEFDAKLTDWERLEDQDGARQKAERAHENRKYRIHADYDGVHTIDGHLAGLPGVEVKAIHDHFRKKEWEADWAEARERLGDAATTSDLRRTDAQRSADAAVAAWRAANRAQADEGGSLVVVNIEIDDHTLEREIHHACGNDQGPDPRAATLLDDAIADLDGAPLADHEEHDHHDGHYGHDGHGGHEDHDVAAEPDETDGDPTDEHDETMPVGRPAGPISRFRCCTEDGVPLHPSEALGAALVGHVRRVILGADGVVLDMGRLERLFKGPRRAAVMLSGHRCGWVGCLVPGSECQADHLDAFNGPRQGCTCPENGGPLCGRHNRAKERGFTLYRDERGRMHVLRPDGTEII